MINTGYTALSNTGNMASLQAYSLGLASGVARTLASTSTASVLKTGSRGAAVTELQKNLTKLGYDTKGTEGIFGMGTKNAVIAFQRDYGLSSEGMVGNDTKNVINSALKNIGSEITNSTGSTVSIQKMLDNLKNDTSLGISEDKKTAMLKAAERLLNDNYEPEFVAGVLGNIQNEGTPGVFESSAYKTESDKPTKEECIMAEVNFMADELVGSYAKVYSNWKNGDKSASSADDIICRQYEIPADTDKQARLRAQNANKIYAVMMK